MIFERSTESCAPFFSAQNKKVRTNKHNNKSFVHLFKGGGFPKGRALWSLSADSEIPRIQKNGARGEKCESISRGSDQERSPF